MAAHRVPLKIDQGATFRKVLTWKVGEVPALVDLTGCTARLQARLVVDAPDVLFELSSVLPGSGITLGGTAGTIALHMAPATTALLPTTDAVYDLEVTFPDGDVRRLAYGPVCVSPEVTR